MDGGWTRNISSLYSYPISNQGALYAGYRGFLSIIEQIFLYCIWQGTSIASNHIVNRKLNIKLFATDHLLGNQFPNDIFPLFSSSYLFSQSAPSALLIKHWPNARALGAASQTMTLHKMTFVLFSNGNMFPLFLTLINYILSVRLQLSNGMHLYKQQETRPYVSGFPWGCCDQSSECTSITTAWWKETLIGVVT
jgi:hypothetical protein